MIHPPCRREAAPAPLVRLLLAALALLLLLPVPLAAQEGDGENDPTAEYVRSHYTKREVYVPMRDGVRLFTSIYTPNDLDASRTYPILLQRTPYSVRPYGLDEYKRRLGPTSDYAREGFIFVYQDVRGTWMSEGEFVNMRPQVPRKGKTGKTVAQKGPGEIDESTDTWDTIQWLVENVERHNGKVGLWGISYPGFYAAAGAIDSHPALVAVSPQAPIADWFFDDMHHHGAFILPLAFNFFAVFGQDRPEPTDQAGERLVHGTADGYRFFLDLGPLSNANERFFHGEIDFWNDIVAHPNYDEFWQSRSILPHLHNVGAAVMTVGGWYDAEDLYGPLKTYRSIEEKNPDAWNMLVMGPWPHGGWSRGDGRELGDQDFGFATGEWYVENVELPFFRHFLKGEGGKLDLPEALMFETGADRWRRFTDWPPKGLRQAGLYLREDGALALDVPPGADEAQAPGDPQAVEPAAGGGDAAAAEAAQTGEGVEPAGEAQTTGDGGARTAEGGAGAAGAGSGEAAQAQQAGDGGAEDADPGYDQYVSDPDRPVPYTTELTVWWARNYMTEDQRFASRRPDVLVYESEPLEEPLTLAGPLVADLWVSTSGGDSDWIVKVIDVLPTDEPEWKEVEGWRHEEDPEAGAQLLVRGEVFRGRFRNSYEHPEPFTPGEPTRVTFELQDVLHTFQRGHRVMIQIQSTWFPLVDRNPGSWVDNIFLAEEDDFVPVTNRIYRTPDMPSHVRVGVLEE